MGLNSPYFFSLCLTSANPPFAGDIESDETLSKYELAYKVEKGGSRKRLNKVAKEKLFIERCINMLVPGGRMAIVLPRGVLKNYSDERVRRYILRNAKILGVVGLGSNMFKPFTNTKTVVLFLQKRYKALSDEQVTAHERQSEIAFCVTEKPGKDKTGKIVTDTNGDILSDLPEITEYLNNHVCFQTLESLRNEYNNLLANT